jgi:hypothetical protein
LWHTRPTIISIGLYYATLTSTHLRIAPPSLSTGALALIQDLDRCLADDYLPAYEEHFYPSVGFSDTEEEPIDP